MGKNAQLLRPSFMWWTVTEPSYVFHSFLRIRARWRCWVEIQILAFHSIWWKLVEEDSSSIQFLSTLVAEMEAPQGGSERDKPTSPITVVSAFWKGPIPPPSNFNHTFHSTQPLSATDPSLTISILLLFYSLVLFFGRI